MLKSTIIDILRSFSKDDLINFENFIMSPYFNENSNAVKLFSILKSNSPAYESEKINKEFIWEVMFPEKDYNYGIMKNIILDLDKLCKEYITQVEFEKSDTEKNDIMVRALNKRNIKNIFTT